MTALNSISVNKRLKNFLPIMLKLFLKVHPYGRAPYFIFIAKITQAKVVL